MITVPQLLQVVKNYLMEKDNTAKKALADAFEENEDKETANSLRGKNKDLQLWLADEFDYNCLHFSTIIEKDAFKQGFIQGDDHYKIITEDEEAARNYVYDEEEDLPF